MLDVHCSCAPSEPSSASFALPAKDTEVPAVNVAPFDGEVITTTGGVMGVPLTMLVMARKSTNSVSSWLLPRVLSVSFTRT